MTDPKRMTDEDVRRARISMDLVLDFDCQCDDEEPAHVGKNGHVPFCVEHEAENAFNALVADHDRARASEAKQDEALKAKDVRISQLEAALMAIRDEGHERGMAWAQKVARASLGGAQ